MMDVKAIVQPFVERGLFDSPESAVSEMARDYIVRQVERYQRVIEAMEAKYGMSYSQFEAYLRLRAAQLEANHDLSLNQSIIAEEEDALDWKIARDMLQRWLGLQSEAVA